MKISELASQTNTPVETIRYYERGGLLPSPARTAGNYRVYDDSHKERLSFIRYCRNLDMSLEEVRVLLLFKDTPSENCQAVNELLDEHIGHVAQRIRELRQLEKELRALRDTCRSSQQAGDCGILHGITEIARGAANTPSREGHVHGAHGTAARKKRPQSIS